MIDIERMRDDFRRFYNSMVTRCNKADYNLVMDCGGHAVRKRVNFDISTMMAKDIRHWRKWIIHRMHKRGIISKPNKIDKIKLPWKKDKEIEAGIVGALEARGD